MTKKRDPLQGIRSTEQARCETPHSSEAFRGSATILTGPGPISHPHGPGGSRIDACPQGGVRVVQAGTSGRRPWLAAGAWSIQGCFRIGNRVGRLGHRPGAVAGRNPTARRRSGDPEWCFHHARPPSEAPNGWPSPAEDRPAVPGHMRPAGGAREPGTAPRRHRCCRCRRSRTDPAAPPSRLSACGRMHPPGEPRTDPAHPDPVVRARPGARSPDRDASPANRNVAGRGAAAPVGIRRATPRPSVRARAGPAVAPGPRRPA